MSSNEPVRIQHPLNPAYLLRTNKRLRRQLRETSDGRQLKIAILGGSTTAEIGNLLELFLLAEGFRPDIYQSEYNRYYEDALYGNDELSQFAPDTSTSTRPV